MLEWIGIFLNWLVAGLLFPLLFIPLARLVAHKSNSQFFIWLILVLGSVTLASFFLISLPEKGYAPFRPALGIWALSVVIVGALINLFGGFEKWGHQLSELTNKLTRSTARTVMWLVIVMALVQFSIVILRYVFGVNSIWMQESITYMHGAVFLLAAGYALITDDHVRVDVFYRESSERRKAIINLFGTYTMLIPVCLLLLWTAAPYVFSSWQSVEGSNETSGLPLLFLLKSLIPAFAILLLLAAYHTAYQNVDKLLIAKQKKRTF